MTSLRNRILGAAGIVLMTTGATLVVRVLSSITLTRLLTPDAFGLVGVINAIFFAITMLSDIGIQSYLLRHAEADNPRFRDVIWTIHLWRSILLFIVALAGAPFAAQLLGKPELEWPLVAASSTLLFAGLTSLAPITEIRAGRIGRLSLVDLVLTVLQSAVRAAISYIVFPDARRSFAFDRAWSREMFGFSKVVLMSSALTLALSQADKFALARAMTLHDFGFYAIALNLAAIPLSFLNAWIGRVLYPAYARCWNDTPERFAAHYYAARRNVSFLYALGTGALVGGAAILVMILYDPRYLAVWPYLSLLAVGAVMRLPNVAATEAMTAMGHVQITLYANVVRLVWLLAAGTAGYLLIGPMGVVAAVGLIELPPMLYCWAVLRRERIFRIRAELAYLGVAICGVLAGFALSSLITGLLR